MCDCIEEISKQLISHVEPKIKEYIGYQGITGSGFVNAPLLVIGGTTAPVYLPFEIEYERKAKGSGNVKRYKEKVNYFPSYCPVCGENYALEAYKEKFVKYITDLGIELHMAESEYEGQIENMGDDLDLSDPEDDARECLTYWEE
ncbi:hypothetical protein KAR91_45750 [Candidatus Pacearchaeota archaeon]|nr:hypothetical protein [Candidatus Pacearchaeota archaeon]